MAELVGNVLVGQSGGPTSVINASVAGIVSEALNHECIEEIYGTLNGVLGMAQALDSDGLTPPQKEKVGVILDSGKSLMALLSIAAWVRFLRR